MAEGVNVRFAGELQNFIKSRVIESGLYNSASEYLRDLVRRDYEREEQRKLSLLRAEFPAVIPTKKSEFVPLQPDEMLKETKSRRPKPVRL
jgi:antitoxin ParD1/3/4